MKRLLLLTLLTPALMAFSFTGAKYNHAAITYSCGNQTLAQAVQEWAAVSALEDGGCTDTNPDIVIQVVSPWPYGSQVAGLAGWQVGAGGFTVRCVISVKTTGIAHLGVITHEVGHCIGLGHSADASANMAAFCCNPLNADDIAGAQSLYGTAVAATPATPSPGASPTVGGPCVGLACVTRTPTMAPSPTPSKIRVPMLARD